MKTIVRFVEIVGAIVVGGALCSSVVMAVEVTTSNDLRAVTRFATEKQICKVNNLPDQGDCQKRETSCDAKQWKEFVEYNVDFKGGSPTQKKGASWAEAAIASLSPINRAVYQVGGRQFYDGEILPSSVYAYLGKDLQNRLRIPRFIEATCFCECNGKEDEICRSEKGTPFKLNTSIGGKTSTVMGTMEECKQACQDSKHEMANKCAGSIGAQEKVDSSDPTAVAAQQASLAASDLNALCWTPEQCGKKKGVFQTDTEFACDKGMGRCYADEPEIELNTTFGGVTKVKGLSGYILAAFRYAVSIVAIVATIMFIVGAFMFMLSASLPSISSGKSIMFDAIIGFLLVIGSVAILRTINPDLLNLQPIKVYMINTVQFVSAADCKDLGSGIMLADAGEPPAVQSYDQAKNGGFTTPGNKAVCGHKYYAENALGNPCEGSFCEAPGELCISCADGVANNCGGTKSDRKVCDKVTFAGTIKFDDGRFPLQVRLLLLCNWAQPAQGTTLRDGRNAFYANTWGSNVANLSRTGFSTGAQVTDVQQSGVASYRFNIDSSVIEAMGDENGTTGNCAGKGGFRGALIAVQYQDDQSAPSGLMEAYRKISEGDTTQKGINPDFFIASKPKCGGEGPFDGYAYGQTGVWDAKGSDIALAGACAILKHNKLIGGTGAYWTRQELLDAMSGTKPIKCDLTLHNANTRDQLPIFADTCILDTWRPSVTPDSICSKGATCSTVNSVCFLNEAANQKKQPCKCVGGIVNKEFLCEENAACVAGGSCKYENNICNNGSEWCTCRPPADDKYALPKWLCETTCAKDSTCSQIGTRCIADNQYLLCEDDKKWH